MKDDRIEPTFDLDENESKEEKSSFQDLSLDKDDDKLSLDDDIFSLSDDKPDAETNIAPDRKQNNPFDDAMGSDFDHTTKTDSLFAETPAPVHGTADRFSLFTGRIDRLQASMIVVASSIISLLLILFMDDIFYFVLNNTTGTVSKDAYQTNPLVYIGIGASFWLVSLLIVAMGRLRDRGFSPALAIFLFVPPITFIIIYLMVLPGSPDRNRYGLPSGAYGPVTWVMAGLSLGALPILIYMNWGNLADYLIEIVKRFNPS